MSWMAWEIADVPPDEQEDEHLYLKSFLLLCDVLNWWLTLPPNMFNLFLHGFMAGTSASPSRLTICKLS